VEEIVEVQARDGPILSAKQIFEAFAALKQTIVKPQN